MIIDYIKKKPKNGYAEEFRMVFYYFYTQFFLWAALIIYYFFFRGQKNIVNFFFFLTSKVGKYATRDYLNYENERWGDSWNDLLVGRDFFLFFFLCENKLIY